MVRKKWKFGEGKRVFLVGKISTFLATEEEFLHPPLSRENWSIKDHPSLIFSIFLLSGQKKLGKVITPDPWKKGARNTTGKKILWMKIVCGSAEFRRLTLFFRSIKFCVTATWQQKIIQILWVVIVNGNQTSTESEVSKCRRLNGNVI